MNRILSFWRARPLASFLVIAGALTAARIAGLFFADANLGPDEAQYWIWSKAPAFGYYSKPPLIAWVIGAATALFGDAEWAVRLPAPLFHFGASCFLFALARRLYGETAGLLAGAGWITLPGVSLSASLMTTDAPLLFFWSAALFLFFRILTDRRAGAPALPVAAGLGAAIGLGLLAKYAMIYFPIGAGAALALSDEARRGWRWRDAAAASAVALLIVAPNLLWNAAHDFQTLAHTAANANWGRNLFHPAALAEFLGAQFAVFGPLPMALLVIGLFTLGKRLPASGPARGADIALLAFTLTPLIVVAAQALIARAHANWAASAYPAGVVLVAAWGLRARLLPLLAASTAFHLVLAAALVIGFANFALIDALGLSNAVKRIREWPAQGAYVREAAKGYDAILVDDRELMGELLYYARSGPPIVAWNSNHRIDSHYEAFMAYDPEAAPRALFVDYSPDPVAVAYDFASVTPAGSSTVDLKRGKKRTLYLFAVSGYGKQAE